jgi:hypothetical protein
MRCACRTLRPLGIRSCGESSTPRRPDRAQARALADDGNGGACEDPRGGQPRAWMCRSRLLEPNYARRSAGLRRSGSATGPPGAMQHRRITTSCTRHRARLLSCRSDLFAPVLQAANPFRSDRASLPRSTRGGRELIRCVSHSICLEPESPRASSDDSLRRLEARNTPRVKPCGSRAGHSCGPRRASSGETLLRSKERNTRAALGAALHESPAASSWRLVVGTPPGLTARDSPVRHTVRHWGGTRSRSKARLWGRLMDRVTRGVTGVAHQGGSSASAQSTSPSTSNGTARGTRRGHAARTAKRIQALTEGVHRVAHQGGSWRGFIRAARGAGQQ